MQYHIRIDWHTLGFDRVMKIYVLSFSMHERKRRGKITGRESEERESER